MTRDILKTALLLTRIRVEKANHSGKWLKNCSFGEQIHWFRVDGRPIRKQKFLGLNGQSHKLALLLAKSVTLDSLLKTKL